MDLVAFLLFPILGIATLIMLVSPQSKGLRLRTTFKILGIPFLIFFLDEILGQSYLRTRCAIEGGSKYAEPIHAEGYYFSNKYNSTFDGCAIDCIEALLVHKFHYFETNVGYQYPYFTKHQGVHRFFLVDKKSGLCSTEGNQFVGGWGTIPSDKCIAYTRLQKPESRYEVFVASGDHWDQSNKIGYPPFNLERNYSYILDRSTGKIFGSTVSLSYWGGWVRNASIGHNSATVCPSYSESFGAIFKKIITPPIE